MLPLDMISKEAFSKSLISSKNHQIISGILIGTSVLFINAAFSESRSLNVLSTKFTDDVLEIQRIN